MLLLRACERIDLAYVGHFFTLYCVAAVFMHIHYKLTMTIYPRGISNNFENAYSELQTSPLNTAYQTLGEGIAASVLCLCGFLLCVLNERLEVLVVWHGNISNYTWDALLCKTWRFIQCNWYICHVVHTSCVSCCVACRRFLACVTKLNTCTMLVSTQQKSRNTVCLCMVGRMVRRRCHLFVCRVL